MNVDDRLYALIQFTASRILSSVRMMSDGSLLTGCCMMTCCLQLSGSTQRRRRCFDGEAVVDQTWCLLSLDFAIVMLLMSLTFLRRCPAVHSLYFLYLLSTAAEFWRTRPIITHWWLMTFTSSKSVHNLCSFPLIGRLGWRHRLIWSLIAWPYMQISIHLSMCIRCLLSLHG